MDSHINNLGADRERKLLLYTLVLSLLLHLALKYAQNPFGTQHVHEAEKDYAPIELSEVPPYAPPTPQAQPQTKPSERLPKQRILPNEKQIAETEDAKNREIDPNAKFLSDKNQKVDKQSKADKVDTFQKKEGTGAKGEEKAKGGDTAVGAVPDWMSSQGEPAGAGAKKNWKELNLGDLGIKGGNGMEGATDDYLRNVDKGEQTLLSTREFKYYAYYHRVKELLRQQWRPNIERQINRLASTGRYVQEDEFITQLSVMLNEKGEVKKISKLTSSGVEDFDAAAIQAFNLASPFPNPPKGMLDEDGYVRIRWDFILQTTAAPRINFRSAGQPQRDSRGNY